MDRRRRQWVPLSVYFASSKTGTKLRAAYGRDGLLVWVLYLSACKRGWTQGTFTYASEADGLDKLGLTGEELNFTLEDFFKTTGTLKQTSRRRLGDLTDVTCSHWEEWNKDVEREKDAERKSWKRADKTPDKARTVAGIHTDDIPMSGTIDVKQEQESDSDSKHAGNAAAFSLRNELRAISFSEERIPAALAEPDRTRAWLNKAKLEANSNPAGYVWKGITSEEWPAEVNGQAAEMAVPSGAQGRPATKPFNAEHFVRSSGYLMLPEDLDAELADRGIEDHHRLDLLELAAELQAEARAKS